MMPGTVMSADNAVSFSCAAADSPKPPERRRRSRASRVDYKKLAGESGDESESDLVTNISRSIYDSHTGHSNGHVVKVESRLFDDASSCLQTLEDGSVLTAEALREGRLDVSRPFLITDTPESLGMTVPETLTVREVAESVGSATPVNVMDSATQEELPAPKWRMSDLVDYFESPKRNNGRGKALNQISLEFSRTPLINQVRSPKFVRGLDWIETAWPRERKEKDNEYPRVQYYCLTSAAGCYTDFHIDFGGTSVWYHVISGRKVFLLLPPTPDNVRKYERWLCHPQQNKLFFPDFVSEDDAEPPSPCHRVTLEASRTLIIPTGWIHAVYTPDDSVVVGGNFLHSLDISGQLRIYALETRTHVPKRFRLPFFEECVFYAAAYLLRRSLRPVEHRGLPALVDFLRASSVRQTELAMDAASRVGLTVDELIERLEKKSKGGADDCGSSGGKVKLKLSLKRTDGGAEEQKKTETSFTAPPKCRIFVPKEDVFSLKTVRKRPEMTIKTDVGLRSDDGEWRPKSSNKKKKKESNAVVKTTTTTMMKTKTAAKKPAAAKKTTSRQRLKKKLGF